MIPPCFQKRFHDFNNSLPVLVRLYHSDTLPNELIFSSVFYFQGQFTDIFLLSCLSFKTRLSLTTSLMELLWAVLLFDRIM